MIIIPNSGLSYSYDMFIISIFKSCITDMEYFRNCITITKNLAVHYDSLYIQAQN